MNRTKMLLDTHLQKQKSKATASLETVAPVSDTVLRVVAKFNRNPSAEELAHVMSNHFGNRVEVVAGSFFSTHGASVGRTTITGYVRLPTQEMPLSETAGMKEIAKNVYMSDEDNSVWKVVGSNIVKTTKDDIMEVASVAQVRPLNRFKPEEALANVGAYQGVNNTQYIAFLHPETATIQFGARVGEEHVYSAEAGLCEISQLQVAHIRNLRGDDILDFAAAQEVASHYDIQRTVDYYEKLFGDDPEFWNQLEDIIRNNAVA